MAFTTPDGIKWSIDGAKNKFTGDGAEVILNVNPDASSVGKTGERGVDYFVIYVKDNGKIYLDEKEKEIILNCKGEECPSNATPTPEEESTPENPGTECTDGKVLIGETCCVDSNPANGTCDEDETPTCYGDKVLIDGVCSCPSGTINYSGNSCCSDIHPKDGKCDYEQGCSDLGADIDNGNCEEFCQHYPDEGVCPEYCETNPCGGSIADDEVNSCEGEDCASDCSGIQSIIGTDMGKKCVSLCNSNPCYDWCGNIPSGFGFEMPSDMSQYDCDGDGCVNDIEYTMVTPVYGASRCVARSRICSVKGSTNGTETNNGYCSNDSDDSFICDDNSCDCYVYPDDPSKSGYYFCN